MTVRENERAQRLGGSAELVGRGPHTVPPASSDGVSVERPHQLLSRPASDRLAGGCWAVPPGSAEEQCAERRGEDERRNDHRDGTSVRGGTGDAAKREQDLAAEHIGRQRADQDEAGACGGR